MGASSVTATVAASTVIASVALGISLLSALAAWTAARANIKSARANTKSASAAETAAKATDAAVKLEVQRRHAELTPRFRLNWELRSGTDDLRLDVLLTGPVQLERLDNLTLTVLDNDPWRRETISEGMGITPEQLAEQVLGPFRLRPGVAVTPGSDPADAWGRAIRTNGLQVGESMPFILETTPPASWWTQTPEQWRAQNGPKLRLRLRCERDDWEPWTVPCQFETTSSRREIDV
jgi:hypothetical protein